MKKGTTPDGAEFEIKPGHLEWKARNGIGSIGIPLKQNAPLSRLYDELVKTGRMSEETHKASVAT